MSEHYFWLTAEQFSRLEPLLPGDKQAKPQVDDRRVISGIIHVLKSGGRWVDAPDICGPHKALYNRFVRWAARGIWTDIFHILASAGGPPAHVLIDNTAVKAPRCAASSKRRERRPIFRSGSTGCGSRASRRFCTAIAMPSSACLDASGTSAGLQQDTTGWHKTSLHPFISSLQYSIGYQSGA